MFSFQTKNHPFLFSSLVAIALYVSHLSFVVLEEMAYWQRVAYLKNHYQRTAQREADREKLARMEDRDRIEEIIGKHKPDLSSKEIVELTRMICDAGENYNYDPVLLLAVIFTESSMVNQAVSKVGATGLMQIRPFVGKDLAQETNTEWEGQKTLFDPSVNIRLGVHYLGKLSDRFGGDIPLVLEAYNNGPTHVKKQVDKYGYFSSSYSKKVLRTYEKFKQNLI